MSYMLIQCPLCDQLLERYFPTTVYGKIEFYCKTFGIAAHNFQIRYNVETHNLSSISVREGNYSLDVYYGLKSSNISQRVFYSGFSSAPGNVTESREVICKVGKVIPYDLLNAPDLKKLILPYIAFS